MNKIFKSRHKRIGYFLVIAVLFLLIVFIGYMFGRLYENYCGEILNRELTRLLTIARSNAAYMQFYYHELHTDCHTWIKDNELSERLGAGTQEDVNEVGLALKRFFAANANDYLYAAVLDADGCVLSSYGHDDEDMPARILNIPFEEGTHERGFWMDEDTYALAYGIRIYREREIAGAFIGVLDLSSVMQRLFRYVRIGNEGSLSVCDPNGVVLLHPKEEMLGRKIYASAAPESRLDDSEDIRYINDAIAKKERGKAIYSIERAGKKEPMLMAYSRTNLAPSYYIITATLPYGEVISSIQSTVKQAIGAFVLLLSMIILLLAAVFWQLRKRALAFAEQRHLTELNNILLNIQSRQNQLHQKENLQAIGVFASGIAHEFSNLLTPIMAYCEMLMLKHNENKDLYDSLLEIHQSASSSRALARQLLSFSRSSKPSETIRTPISINDLLQNCIRSISIQASNQICVDAGALDEELFVLGNQSMLHQAINNLLTNACQSMNEGGTLSIRCEKVCAQEVLASNRGDDLPFIGDGVRIIIEDTGCGMDQQTLDRIFIPFFTTKKSSAGTGLGLMIVQNVINRHDGWIDVSSEPGKGSRFMITLPEYICLEEDLRGAEQGRIMVVHSEQSDNMHLFNRLKSDGEELVFYTEPLDAIRDFAAHANSYSLLITEYALEGFSGISLIRTFRRIDPQFPVVLMTSLIHPSKMVFDSASTPNEVVLNSVTYAQFKEGISKWKKGRKGAEKDE